jgi:arsenate reductase
VNPYAIAELARRGIQWDGRTPKTIDDVAGESFQLVITVCDNAHEACPFFPGAFAQVHWGLPDPADETEPAAAQTAFARTFDALEARISALLTLPLESLDADALTRAAQGIHDTLPQHR